MYKALGGIKEYEGYLKTWLKWLGIVRFGKSPVTPEHQKEEGKGLSDSHGENKGWAYCG